MKTMTTALIGSLLALSAMAQDVPPEELIAEEQEDIRRYTVEVIIFSYEEDVSVGTEVFPPDPPPEEPTIAELLELLEEGAETEGIVNAEETEDEEEAPEFELTLLTDEEYTLTEIADKFELLDVYQTVMHFGWTQTTYPEAATPPIELRMFGEPPPGLDGSFTLYLSRYLHLVVDLALQAPTESRPESSWFNKDSDWNLQPVFYRIQEDRIFKNGDVRYFDHPRFGVVAKITRVEEEEPEEDETEAEALISRSFQ